MNAKRWTIAFFSCAAIGLGVFGLMVAQVTSVERMEYEGAVARIDSVRTTFANPEPVVHTNAAGELEIDELPNEPASRIRTLHVLAYRGEAEGLVQVDIPVWFLRMKDPAIRFVLDDTGVNLKELGLSINDLRRRGPRVIVDERRPNGDLVLLWTEG